MEVFVAVAEAGSFTAAAESLHLTPSGVSKLIGRLEDRLGTRLLHRTTRRVSLTAEGRAYLDQVRGILTEIDAVEASIGGAEAEPRGLLRINLAHGFGMTQVVPVIPEQLRERYRELVKGHIAAIEGGAGASGMDYHLFDTRIPLGESLHAYLARREHMLGARGVGAGGGGWG